MGERERERDGERDRRVNELSVKVAIARLLVDTAQS